MLSFKVAGQLNVLWFRRERQFGMSKSVAANWVFVLSLVLVLFAMTAETRAQNSESQLLSLRDSSPFQNPDLMSRSLWPLDRLDFDPGQFTVQKPARRTQVMAQVFRQIQERRFFSRFV